ncbi:MAG TPA: amino acid racemase [Phycisphaerales bacterium]|nr:amino acid racemase [Phycisphaerales bacterium]
MAKHIGIIAVSPEGAALFYGQLTRHLSKLAPPNDQPRITIHNEPVNSYIDSIRRGDWHAVARLMRRSADVVIAAGAEVCLVPDNIVQHAVHLAESGSTVPWLPMTDLVAQSIATDHRKVVGVIGTKLVTESSTYQTPLGIRGIQVLPPTGEEADLLEQIIFGELLYGHIRPESRSAVHEIISHFARRGCEGVILGCSEAPLVVTKENSCLPVYDAADILAERAVKFCLTGGSHPV